MDIDVRSRNLVKVNLFGMGGLSNPKEYILSTRKFTYNECALLVVVLFE